MEKWLLILRFLFWFCLLLLGIVYLPPGPPSTVTFHGDRNNDF